LPFKKENYPKLVASINYNPASDAILTYNAQLIHGLKYYSNLPVYIDAKPGNVSQFDGKAIIKESDYLTKNKNRFTRVWVPYLAEWNNSGINAYKATLKAQGFNEAYTIQISKSLYLSLFDRRVLSAQ
jgi:hypothetical protein